VPARFLFLFIFLSSILAATAFDEFQRYRAKSSSTHFFARALVILFVFLTGSEIVFAYAATKEFWIMLSSYLSWILVFLGIVVIVFGFTRLGTNTVYAVVALGLTVFDLATFAPHLLPSLTATVHPPV
jgi:hypothetical protein